MSGKNAKNRRQIGSAMAVSATARRYEWRVIHNGGESEIPPSSCHIWPNGGYAFRDEEGIVADFQQGTVTGVLRKVAREPVRVPLPTRFITTPASVSAFQQDLRKATGIEIILLVPDEEKVAGDTVSVVGARMPATGKAAAK